MVDDETADWWKPNDTRPLTFEQRIPQVMIPNMEAKGLNPSRKPDLIVLSSLFWDENYIAGVSPSIPPNFCSMRLREMRAGCATL